MRPKPTELIAKTVRLVSDAAWDQPDESPTGPRLRHVFRPLMAGLAILYRRVGSRAVWTIDIADDDRLIPHAPRSVRRLERVVQLHRALGKECRVAAALASTSDIRPQEPAAHQPVDQPAALGMHRGDRRNGRMPEIYGWAIIYQLPGMRGTALVDAHEQFADLPAFYESPLELIDRMDFLSSKGVPHRPIALVTRPEDFTLSEADGRPRNRFFPRATFRRPCGLDALV